MQVSPYAESIVSILPPLWEQSGQEHLLKQAILTLLARLINAMKDESRHYHPLVLPLIKYAVEPGSVSLSCIFCQKYDNRLTTHRKVKFIS